MTARHAVLGLCAAALLAACGSSTVNEAQGLVGSTAPAAPSTTSAAPATPTSATPTPTPTPTATPKPTATKAASTPAPVATKKASPTPTKTKAAQHTDPRFATCKAAKAAGYGPYYRGKDPEYSWYKDRDGDGVVCE